MVSKSETGNAFASTKLWNRLVPGTVDGAFAGLVLVGLCTAISNVIDVFDANHTNLNHVVQWVAVGLCCIASNVVHFWLIFSDRSALHRMAVAVSFNAFVAFCSSASFVFIRPHVYHRAVYMFDEQLKAIVTQRFTILMVVVVLGGFITACSSWRIVFLNTEGSVRPQKRVLSIATLIIWTTVVAAVFAMVKAGAKFHLNQMSSVELLTGLSLLVPMFVAFFVPWCTRRFPLFVFSLWSILSAIAFLLGVVFVGIEFGSFSELRSTSMVVLAYCFVTAICLQWMRWQGFQLANLKNDAAWQPIAFRTRRWNWSGLLVGLLMIAVSVLCYGLCEIPVLVSENSVRVAIQAKHVSRITGQPYLATDQSWKVSDSDSFVRMAPNYDAKFRPALQGLDDPTILIDAFGKSGQVGQLVVQSDHLDASHLAPIRRLSRVNWFSISARSVDEAAFEDLLRNGPKFSMLGLRLAKGVQEAHVLALDSQPIESADFFQSVLQLTPETQEVLQKMQFLNLQVRYDSPEVPRFDEFSSVSNLRIYDSSVDGAIAAQLSRIAGLQSVFFSNCSFDRDALAALSQQTSRVHIENNQPTLSRDDVLLLAVKPKWAGIRITQNGLDQQLEAELIEAIGEAKFMSVDIDSYDDVHDIQRTLTVNDVPHFTTKDENGSIVGLDVVGIESDGSYVDSDEQITEGIAEEIAAISTLARLRIPTAKHSGEDQPYFRLLELDSLTVLELTNGCGLNDAGMAAIGKLQKLKRLQLPFTYDHTFPEEFPFDLEKISDQAKFARQLRLRRDGSYAYRPPRDNPDGLAIIHVTQHGVAELAKLQQLEYLLLPGYLLDEYAIQVIGSLPNLTELHALFSLSSRKELAQLSKLSNLTRLSIGIEVDDADAILEFCEVMQQLDFLQLFVMDIAGTNRLAEEVLRSKIERILPNSAIHIIFYPKR